VPNRATSLGIKALLLLLPNTLEVSYENVRGESRGAVAAGYTF
jgi:hypothetical protein